MLTRAVLALLLAAAPIAGAPVPPPPKELTAEMLVGAWRYEWGTLRNSRLWLFADGTFTAHYGPDSRTVYVGDWHLERGALVLTEYRFDLDLGRGSERTVIRLAFDARTYPRLVGRADDDTRVALTDPQR